MRNDEHRANEAELICLAQNRAEEKRMRREILCSRGPWNSAARRKLEGFIYGTTCAQGQRVLGGETVCADEPAAQGGGTTHERRAPRECDGECGARGPSQRATRDGNDAHFGSRQIFRQGHRARHEWFDGRNRMRGNFVRKARGRKASDVVHLRLSIARREPA